MNKNVTPQDDFLRKRIARQRKIRKRRLKIFFTLFVIFLLGLSVILCLTVFFPIENLSARGSQLYKAQEIIKASDIELGDNLFAITEGNTLKKIKSKLPYIESVKFKRTLPGNLSITVKDAEEYACYFDGKAYYTVSESGWVLKKEYENPENIFTIKGAKAECKVGSAVVFKDEEIRELIEKLIATLKEQKLSINTVDVSDKLSITLRIEGRFNVDLGTANYVSEKIKHLASMVENISAEKAGKINLSMWTNTNTQGTFVQETNE